MDEGQWGVHLSGSGQRVNGRVPCSNISLSGGRRLAGCCHGSYFGCPTPPSHSLTLPSHDKEVPSLQMVFAIPWLLPLNQMPCSHLLLHVTAHHRHSSKEWQKSFNATEATVEGTKSSVRCWELSIGHPLSTDGRGDQSDALLG